ncbi:MAG: MBL fold metallo-hydrolase [Bacteroidetes bacterium]|nr:MAG: MBL fold metallo-hydrolase [Bacteroidota bacterium]
MKWLKLFVLVVVLFGCKEKPHEELLAKNVSVSSLPGSETTLVILGTIQDAGSPHIACKKDCCAYLFCNPIANRKVVSLGIVDPESQKTFLFEATPDITTQLKMLRQFSSSEDELPDGIFLTHAHIGHYSGLMYLGKEAANADHIPVYAMPRMKDFLESNGPWSQLVTNNNIDLVSLENNHRVQISSNVAIIPFRVPHRDEFSETIGYRIIGPNKTALFIPDIDKWEMWDTDISEVISQVDYAFLDATFFNGDEIDSRDISEIPHPFIIESMKKFQGLSISEKNKIHFIHFNHTNPMLNQESEAYKLVLKNGFNVAKIHEHFKL